MDPTLAYGERLSLTGLDLQALDVLGYDIDASKIGDTLDLKSLMEQAQAKVSAELGINLADLASANGETDLYQMGFNQWWSLFQEQIHQMGFNPWWDTFEKAHQYWQQDLAGETLEMGFNSWWQLFDHKMNELESELLTMGFNGFWMGSNPFWQEFKQNMLDMGFNGFWEVFEMGFNGFWQNLDTFFSTLEKISGEHTSIVDQILNGVDPNDTTQTTTTGGDEDDIIGGTQGRDLITGLKGDDLIDGKEGADLLMGDEGDDMIYGFDHNDTVFGGQGDDFIAGERDHDQLYGEAGADIISGGAGNDFLDGGEGKDVLKGDQGIDILMGGTEDDVLEGGENNDLLLGEQGKDLLDGGAGNDILHGDGYFTPVNTDNYEPDVASLQAEIGVSANGNSPDGINFWMRLEAESMDQLIHYNQAGESNASEQGVITTGGHGKARTNFTGPTGTYDLVIAYYDDAGGQGQITVKVGDQEVDNWILNQDSNGLVTRTIQGVELTNGDRIELQGQTNGNEFVRIDYVDIIGMDEGSSYDYNNLNLDNLLNFVLPTNIVEADPFRLEAEAMTLTNGYQVGTHNSPTSGSGFICNPNDGQQATATYIFDGNSGVYNIFASYLDGIGGNAQAEIKLNGVTLASWLFDQDTGLFEYGLVEEDVSVNQGDTIEIIGTAQGSDLAQIDYIEFVPFSNGDIDDYTDNDLGAVTLTTERVEAENMTLSGNYNIYHNGFASGSKIVESTYYYNGLTATTTFNGTTGLYNIVLGYYDGNNGVAQFNATLNGIQELDSWQADLNLVDSWDSTRNFVSRTLARGILLTPGDEFELQAIRGSQGNDLGFIDYVDFVPYDPTAPIRVEAEYMNASGNYALEEYEFVSSGRVLKSNSSNPANALKVSTTFTGESGQYSILVHHFDENDGQAQFSASLGGVTIDSWITDQDLGSNLVEEQTSVIRTLTNSGETLFQLNPGDEFELTVISNNYDYGRVDYVEFVPYNPHATPDPEENAIQLEIEDMHLTGGIVTDKNFAYGGSYVSASSNNSFTASTLFTEEEGYYDIVIGYYDTNQGEASLTVKLNEDELSSWVNNQNFGIDYAGVQSFTTRTVAEAVYLEKEDVIQIIGQEHNGDRVNADYIKLIPVEAPSLVNTPTPTQEISESDNGDILRGGAGNDQLFGDEGDDLLYGEDEYDTPNSSNAGNDTIQGGSGNDTLYGNSGDDLLYGDGMDSTATNKTPSTLTFQQNVNDYNGTFDTFLWGYEANISHGNFSLIEIDTSSSSFGSHGLIRFDDLFGTEAGQIAFDDTIDSAILEFQVDNSGSPFEVYTMLQPWLETDTWNSFNDGIQNNGVEATITPITATNGSVSVGLLQLDITSAVQAWQNNPTQNYGLALLPTNDDGVDLYSSESSFAPRLVVDVNQTVPEIPDGLVGHWTLNETGGSQTKDATESHDGTLNNFATDNSQWVNGQIGNALDFDGVDDQVEVADAPEQNITDAITLAAWVNADNFIDNWDGIIVKGNSTIPYSMNLMSDGSIAFSVNFNTGGSHQYGQWFSTNSLSVNQWQHIAVTYDGSDISFYIDGQLDSSFSNPNLTFATTSQSLWLGVDFAGSHFDGTIDDARLYNRALSDTEIMELTQVESGMIESDLSSVSTDSGNDILTGNSGNDNLFGGDGNDILNGTDVVSVGMAEQDSLTGGGGADKFILGDVNNAYYVGQGTQDFTTVTDFDSNVDSLELHGSIGDYQQSQQGDDLLLSYQNDLIAVFQNSSTLDLNGFFV